MSAGGADLAVIGGGQLARMMQQAAIGLGVRIRLLAEGPDVSAAQVVPDHRVGDHTNLDDLRAVAAGVPVITFDHEHVPPDHLRALEAEGHACRPGPHALLFAQDKGAMRARLSELGVPCPRHASVSSLDDIVDFGFPAVVKTTRGGYDGKGVWVLHSAADAEEALASGRDLLAEELVDFRRELSALVARSPSGEVVAWPVVESRQVDGICTEVVAPAPDLDPALAEEAVAIARTVAEALDVTGVLAVELFETMPDESGSGRILVNELAMRPHNTGHWTIDGAATSQFENHLRAVLDLPLGPTEARAPWSVMVNILGGSVEDLASQLTVALEAVPDVRVHLYGKTVKAGRKVGHVTAVGDDLDGTLARARRAADLFEKGTTDD